LPYPANASFSFGGQRENAAAAIVVLLQPQRDPALWIALSSVCTEYCLWLPCWVAGQKAACSFPFRVCHIAILLCIAVAVSLNTPVQAVVLSSGFTVMTMACFSVFLALFYYSPGQFHHF
jgi:hypothetical protein